MYTVSIPTSDDMQALGKRFGELFRGGECLELIGDVGSGKTTFTKGIGLAMRLDEDVQSPSFTISRVYEARDGLNLQHYDFYRLSEPGVMSYELAESVADPHAVTVIEWAETVEDVLPKSHIKVHFSYSPDGDARTCTINIPDAYSYLQEAVK